ncbi:MAG: hypothetical protein J5526_06830 [Bacteroidales bacterium]|nr:hypothetical protein [Bacteroidales bacterium]
MCKREYNKKQQELESVKPLFQQIGVSNWQDSERPDFTFDYECKRIGLEVTRSFPAERTSKSNEWHKIENKIKEELNRSELPPRLITYGVASHDDGMKRHKAIAQEIIAAYQYMLDNNINKIYGDDYNGIELSHLTHISFYPGEIIDQFLLAETVTGTEFHADSKCIKDAVERKEGKLAEYKKIDANSAIQEYWLAVFIPPTEFSTMALNEGLFHGSLFNRIYLINGRYKRGDEHHILRLK